jgi:hypothetical protein
MKRGTMFTRSLPHLLGALLLAFCIILPAGALSVTGGKILASVDPGKAYSFPVIVGLDTKEAGGDYALEVRGFGQTGDGMYTTLDPAADTGSYTARPLLSIDKPSFHLDSGKQQEVSVIATIPANTAPGGRYALITVHPVVKSGQAGTSFATGFVIPVLLTINGGTLTETGSITDIKTGELVAGQPVPILTTLTNTGNHHYYHALVNLTVTNSTGSVIATASPLPTMFALVPGNSMTFTTRLATPLAPGSYSIKVDAKIADGMKILDNRTVTITIPETYVAPAGEASVDLLPDTTGTLASPGGEITVSFPQGSVFSAAKVTVKPSAGTLSSPPEGAVAGTSAYILDGIAGLLPKEATIVIKYTPDDLKAAGGDASKLYIARYEAGDRKWTLLSTTTDTGAKTITATTDRLGTFEVMGAQQALSTGAATPQPTKPPAPGAFATVLAACAAFFLLSHGRRR